jgi:hypothetical protein
MVVTAVTAPMTATAAAATSRYTGMPLSSLPSDASVAASSLSPVPSSAGAKPSPPSPSPGAVATSPAPSGASVVAGAVISCGCSTDPVGSMELTRTVHAPALGYSIAPA